MRTPLDHRRWQLANELFAAACALPPGDRTAYLAAACGGDPELQTEVETLLEFAPMGDVLGDAVARSLSAAARQVTMADRIGPYRLVSEIGRGGMGTVYLAEREGDDFHQRVAVKVVRGLIGEEGRRRFRAERRILAGLEHPNIARLIDGGTTDGGVPYLAMEYVAGVPIDTYCNGNDLPVRARVELFCQVCDAVAYAHRRLVVHRDLKPSNILVTPDGTPKLLDFGIAKLLDQHASTDVVATTPSMRLLTPEYASPEQVAGETVTTVSDVYSLGVLLYELLGGRPPYRFESRSPDEIARVVRHDEARKPSTVAPPQLAPALRGDLDTIVLTALNKEPQRRYGSVEQLAEDLRRHLNGHPVQARPATWTYLANRFMRRHRLAVSVAAGILLLIAGFTVALGAYARRAADERDAAEQISRFMSDLFQASDPAVAQGSRVTVRQILDLGAARIRSEFADRPALRARLLHEMGSAYGALSLNDTAEALLAESLAVRESIGDRDSLEAADTMWRLARSYTQFAGRGKGAVAEPMVLRLLDIRRRRLGPRHEAVADALNQLARVKQITGSRWTDVEPVVNEALDILRGISPDHPQLYFPFMQTADGLRWLDVERSEQAAREAVRISLLNGEDTPNVIRAKIVLASILIDRRRPNESEAIARDLVGAVPRVFQGGENTTAQSVTVLLGRSIRQQGRATEAEPMFRKVIAAWRAKPGPGGPMIDALTELGHVLETKGSYVEAEACFREAAAVVRSTFAANARRVGEADQDLAEHLVRHGKAPEALAAVGDLIARQRSLLGDDHPAVTAAMAVQARALAAVGRTAEAAQTNRDVDARRRAHPRAHQ